METTAAPRPRAILVHGSWADGSCWRKIIPRLSDAGFAVQAVQLPLTSFAEDVATVERVLAASPGPTILVGHSYGGAVISAVRRESAEAAGITGLVFVAASAPDSHEPLVSLMTLYPAEGEPATRADGDGFVWADDPANFHDVMAEDLERAEADILFSVQKPVHASIFSAAIERPLWRHLPSTYVVTTQDRLFSPRSQRELAARMGARTIDIDASHMVLMSRPNAIADAILAAAA